jgi:hypothetical protein
MILSGIPLAPLLEVRSNQLETCLMAGLNEDDGGFGDVYDQEVGCCALKKLVWARQHVH